MLELTRGSTRSGSRVLAIRQTPVPSQITSASAAASCAVAHQATSTTTAARSHAAIERRLTPLSSYPRRRWSFSENRRSVSQRLLVSIQNPPPHSTPVYFGLAQFAFQSFVSPGPQIRVSAS